MAPKLILLVEDHPETRKDLASFLRDEGYYVSDVGKYTTAAIGLLNGGGNFDAVVTDYDLKDHEGRTGLDLLALVDREKWPKVRTILMSGQDREVPEGVTFVRKDRIEDLIAVLPPNEPTTRIP